MQNIFISDDTIQLVLIPENDLDRQLLNKLYDNGPLELIKISQPVGVLGTSVQDGILIKKKLLKDDTSQA